MVNKFYDTYTLIMCFYVASSVKGNMTDLYMIGLFPTSGPWKAGQGMLVAAEMAVDDINNRSDILPGYRLQMTVTNTECDAGSGIKALADNVYQPPTKMMIIGAGCSPVSQAVAQAAHRWNLLQISYVSNSPALSNREKYPNFFRLVNSESVLNEARMDISRYFRWRRIATLYQNYQLYSTMIEDLVSRMHQEQFEILKECVFSENPEKEVRRLQEADARIIIAGLYADKARKAFCDAYNMGFYGRQVWMTSGSLSHDHTWWKENDPSINCTQEQLEKALHGTLIVNDNFANLNPTEEGVTRMSVHKFRKLFKERTSHMTQPVAGEERAPTGYDAVWAAALALNATLSHLAEMGSEKTLADFSYDDKQMADLLKNKLQKVDFKSISGHVAFNGAGDSSRLIVVQMIRGSNLSTVGTYDVTKPSGQRLVIGDIWDGHVPRDSKRRSRTVITLPVYIFIPLTSLSGLGICVAVTFLVFNVVNRGVKVIRISSPNINNIVLTGCILAYVSVFIEDIHDTKNSIYCMVKNYFVLLSFSLSFGALFAKTWRTSSIFRASKRMRQLKSHSVKDNVLYLMILGLVFLNSSVLFIWIIIDPQTVVTQNIANMREETDDLIVQYASNRCWSSLQNNFLITILVIQGILLLLGVFLAWETRKVELSILNESRYIGMCIYNVVALGVVGVLVSYSLNDKPSLVYIVTSSIIILCATVTQCLLFIPKVVAFRKFRQGKIKNVCFSDVNERFSSVRKDRHTVGSQTDHRDIDLHM